MTNFFFFFCLSSWWSMVTFTEIRQAGKEWVSGKRNWEISSGDTKFYIHVRHSSDSAVLGWRPLDLEGGCLGSSLISSIYQLSHHESLLSYLPNKEINRASFIELLCRILDVTSECLSTKLWITYIPLLKWICPSFDHALTRYKSQKENKSIAV